MPGEAEGVRRGGAEAASSQQCGAQDSCLLVKDPLVGMKRSFSATLGMFQVLSEEAGRGRQPTRWASQERHHPGPSPLLTWLGGGGIRLQHSRSFCPFSAQESVAWEAPKAWTRVQVCAQNPSVHT